jgi:hypothetical protein
MNITPDISNVIVAGPWSVGKTQFIGRLRGFLEREQGISLVLQHSDRLAFEDAVLKDTENGIMQPDGSILGAHSLVEKMGGRGEVQFRLLDGSLGNEAHRKMLGELTETKPGTVNLVEYALGKKKSAEEGEKLDQSGHFLVEHLFLSGAIHKTLVIQLYAPYKRRFDWNKGRKDGINEETFSIYAKPGGEISGLDVWRMRNHLIRLNNRGSLDNLAGQTYYNYIQLRLIKEGDPKTIEGRPPSIMDRGRR